MQTENWRQIMTSYHDKNFSVIPLNERRVAMLKEWSAYNKEMPDEPLYKAGQRGIGLLPGPESGVMVVDIDTTDAHLIERLKEILPSSPVQRFGSKGVAIVYAYNEKLTSRKFRNIQVELFIDSGYVALPPSHHEKTGVAYKWIGKQALLEVDKSSLPTFGETEIAELTRLDEQYGRANALNNPEGTIGKGGRHDTLLNQAFAGLHANKSVDAIAQEIAWFDLNKHNPPWFVEEMHAKSETEVLEKAKKLVIGAVKTFEKKNGPKDMKPKKAAFNFKPYPTPAGFMGDIVTFVQKISTENSPESALAGALSMMSYLCACRFTCGGQFSNMYIINLAETGSGKSFAMKRIVDGILDKAMRDQLHTRNEYRSEPSVWHDLINHKDTFDTLDEVSTLFKKTADKTQGFGELLMRLWDASDSKWKTPSYSHANKEAKNLPPYLRNPSITMWGASTIKTFEGVIDVSTYENGLLPRTLLLIKEGHGEINESYIDRKTVQACLDIFIASVQTFLEANPIQFVAQGKISLLSPGEVEIEAKEILPESLNMVIHRDDIAMRRRMHKTEEAALKGFMSRYPQHVRKLALIHAVSRNFNEPDKIAVGEEDLAWANDFIEVMVHNNSLFFSRTATATDVEKKNAKVYAYIAAKEGAARGEILRKLKLNGKVLTQILQDLKDAGLIDSVIESNPHKRGPVKESFFAVLKSED